MARTDVRYARRKIMFSTGLADSELADDQELCRTKIYFDADYEWHRYLPFGPQTGRSIVRIVSPRSQNSISCFISAGPIKRLRYIRA